MHDDAVFHEDELDDWHETTGVSTDRARITAQTEVDLLLAIDHLDHATRGVYADWLEENGQLERAEYVRLQDLLVAANGFERLVVVDRCRELAANQDLAWRVLVARPRILNCWRDSGCPGDWGSLAPTGLAAVRYCITCGTCVHYCADERDRERYDERVEPLVIDILSGIRDSEPTVNVSVPQDTEGDEDGTTFDDSIPPWRR